MGEESRLLPPRAGHEPERRQAARQPEPDLPSWPTVLRTTIRLSAQRRRQAMARHKWRTVAFVTAVALIVVAAVIAIAHASGGREALSQRPARSATPRSSGRQQEHRSPAYAGPAFTAARQAAAAWIAGQVAAGVTVACDPQMCQALAAAGLPGADLVRLGAHAPGRPGAALLVATPEARQELGPALAGSYAPVTLASFGTGRASVQVRVVAADGPAAYLAALRADLRARRSAGRRLLRSGRLVVTKTVRRQLAAGDADSRLLLTLAALARHARPEVTALSDAGPGATAALPARTVELTRPPGVPASRARRYLRSLLRLVQRARPLLAPFGSVSATITRHGGRNVLRIAVPAPDPLGLLDRPAARQIIRRV